MERGEWCVVGEVCVCVCAYGVVSCGGKLGGGILVEWCEWCVVCVVIGSFVYNY